MTRARTIYVCQQCGSQSLRWLGRCPDCEAWNSFVETKESLTGSPVSSVVPAKAPVPLTEVNSEGFRRISLSMSEFTRVLGGGIVPGSLVLLGGEPGIGKSTLLLQLCSDLAVGGPVLYVSGEESAQQIKMRAMRLGVKGDKLLVLAETSLAQIAECIENLLPRLVVIDSIQTAYSDELESAAGSVGQLRECTLRLMQVAKATHVPVFLVGHVTKEGAIAGPRVLEHIVDTVLYLEGERFQSYRLLRAVKNRFGSTNEIGVFEMREDGMVEVPNPSEVFLSERSSGVGSTVVVTLEGTRPILLEIQALTSATSFGLPRRTPNGIDFNRLLMLTAVLSKRVGLRLGDQDLFVNVVGGFQVGEPAVDLGVALAIVSSIRNMPVPMDMVVIGEIGLSGELRAVTQVEKRLNEAAKLGFRRCLLPKSALRSLRGTPDIEVVGLRTVEETLGVAFKGAR
ncbi:MAG: DNA repair protein RadA [Chloroflexi bacterium]|nr:DNA repair protein RadA [Chloroflexota bacterium]